MRLLVPNPTFHNITFPHELKGNVIKFKTAKQLFRDLHICIVVTQLLQTAHSQLLDQGQMLLQLFHSDSDVFGVMIASIDQLKRVNE